MIGGNGGVNASVDPVSGAARRMVAMSSDATTMAFSAWYRWIERNQCPNIDCPGVYAVAISDIDLSGREFSYRQDIAYIGMSNSRRGLRGRLGQFDQTIQRTKCLHGGADRMLFSHQMYADLCPKLFVAMWPVQCDGNRESTAALRSMAQVAGGEYEAMASYNEQHGRLPQFNRKKESRKYTRVHGRF